MQEEFLFIGVLFYIFIWTVCLLLNFGVFVSKCYSFTGCERDNPRGEGERSREIGDARLLPLPS